MFGLRDFLNGADQEAAAPELGYSGASFHQLEAEYMKTLGELGSTQDILAMQQAWSAMKGNKIQSWTQAAMMRAQMGDMSGAALEIQNIAGILSPGVRGRVSPGPNNAFIVENFDDQTGEPLGGYAMTMENVMEISMAMQDINGYAQYLLNKRSTNATIRQNEAIAAARVQREIATADYRDMQTRREAVNLAYDMASSEPRLQAAVAQADLLRAQADKAIDDLAYDRASYLPRLEQARAEASKAAQELRDVRREVPTAIADQAVLLTTPNIGFDEETMGELTSGGYIELDTAGAEVAQLSPFMEPDPNDPTLYRLDLSAYTVAQQLSRMMFEGNSLENVDSPASNKEMAAVVADLMFNDASFSLTPGENGVALLDVNGFDYYVRNVDADMMLNLLMQMRASYLNAIGGVELVERLRMPNGFRSIREVPEPTPESEAAAGAVTPNQTSSQTSSEYDPSTVPPSEYFISP